MNHGARVAVCGRSEERLAQALEMLGDNAVGKKVDAAAAGAMTGLQMAMAVGAMLLAFIALIAAMNGLLGWFGESVGFGTITIEGLLGYLFQPIAYVLGVPWAEASIAGGLIGQKLVLNEFVAYIAYLDLADSLSPISQAVVVFALCGFANFASIGIQIGGIGALAPSRRKELSELGLRALLAGTAASLFTAILVGILY